MYPPMSMTARLARVRSDSIWLREEGGLTMYPLSRQQIAHIEVSFGKPRYRRRATIGAVSGAVISGGLVMAAAWISGDERAREVAPLLAAYTVLPGAFMGAVVGVAGLEERWAPARIPPSPSRQ